MSGLLSPDARLRILSDLGLVQAGALLHTYVSGSPSTNLATFSDSALAVPNTNPIVASAGGLFGPIYLTPGTAYKYVLTDALGNAIWAQDPVTAPSTVVLPIAESDVTGLVADLALKAPLASPALTGVPTAPTAAVATNTTQLATTAFVLANAAGKLSLLKTGSGTDSTVGATNLDTIAIAGLTALDTLLVVFDIESAGNTTSLPQLYNSTDAVVVGFLAGGAAGTNLGSGIRAGGTVSIGPRPSGVTAIYAAAAGARSDDANGDGYTVSTFATNWTGAWTLALRHAGVAAGGTCAWSWRVYKVAGQ